MPEFSPETDPAKLYSSIRRIASHVAYQRLFWLPEWARLDWIHDASVDVILKMDQFRGESDFRYWVWTTLKRAAIAQMVYGLSAKSRDIRKQVYIDAPSDSGRQFDAPGLTPQADRVLIGKETLENTLALMHPHEKEFVERNCWNGEPTSEMAKDGRYTSNQIRSKLQLMRLRLRRHNAKAV